ncbi:MAG TPA: glycerol-3-phosphate 1-O-acyltransferase PlsY [Terriglobales bacterium]|nr:glycerol-3-phosphate 1-O-acyltransferase PlsY [Terriglobales bacterium]
MQTYVIVAIIAYLLGSIPFGYILVRLFRKQDVRTIGSGNIGATNVARSGAKGLGIATLILDAAKGYAAVALARLLVYRMPPAGLHLDYTAAWLEAAFWAAALAAIFAILGHMFPIWLKFKGGKGVATGVGVFLAIAPKAVGLVLVIFLVIVWFSRYVSLGSIIATAAFPVLAWVLYRDSKAPIVFIAAAFGAFLIIAKHHQNIRRLLAGTEHRLGEKKTEVRA